MDAAARRTAISIRWAAIAAVLAAYALPVLMPSLGGAVQIAAVVGCALCVVFARDQTTRVVVAVALVLIAIPLIVQAFAALTTWSSYSDFEQPATPVG